MFMYETSSCPHMSMGVRGVHSCLWECVVSTSIDQKCGLITNKCRRNHTITGQACSITYTLLKKSHVMIETSLYYRFLAAGTSEAGAIFRHCF